MRNLKKVTAVAVVVAMVLSLMSFNIFAAETGMLVTITASGSNIGQGSTVTLDVYYSNPDGGDIALSSHGFTLKYDKNVFSKVEDLTAADSVYGGGDIAFEAGKVKFGNAKPGTWNKNKPIATLKFTVAADATLGTTALTYQGDSFLDNGSNEVTSTFNLPDLKVAKVTNIVAVDNTVAKSVAYGTAATAEALGLPTTVAITDPDPSTGTASEVEVTWDDFSAYNPTSGALLSNVEVKGTLKTSDLVLNPKNVKAVAKITQTPVAAKSFQAMEEITVDQEEGKTIAAADVAKLVTATSATAVADAITDTVAVSAWTAAGDLDCTNEGTTVVVTGTVGATSEHGYMSISNIAPTVTVKVATPFQETGAKEAFDAMKKLPAIADVTFGTVAQAIEDQKVAANLYKKLSSAAKKELADNAKAAALIPYVTGSSATDYVNALKTIQAVRATVDVSAAVPTQQNEAWSHAFAIIGAYGVMNMVDTTKFDATGATAAKAEYATAVKKITDAYGWLGLKDLATSAVKTAVDNLVNLKGDADNYSAVIKAQVSENNIFTQSATYMEALRAVSSELDMIDSVVDKAIEEKVEGAEALKAALADMKDDVDAERIEYTYEINNFRVGKSYEVAISRKADDKNIELPAVDVKVVVKKVDKGVVATDATETFGPVSLAAGKSSISFTSELGFLKNEGETYQIEFFVGDMAAAKKTETKSVGAKSNPSTSGNSGNPSGNGYGITIVKSEHGTVKANTTSAVKGTTVKLTVTPDEGYSLDTLKVTDLNNKEITLDGYNFVMPASSVKVTATFKEGEEVDPTPTPGKEVFSDVPSSHWAYQNIMDLYYAGIVNGNDDGTFGTDNNITRAEFTKMAVNVLGLKTGSSASTFVDVTAADWYAPFVVAAVEAGIVQGQSDEWFGANENITREDICTILGRALNLTVPAADLTFKDAAEISSYAVDNVKVLSDLKIVNGYEDGTFGPRKNATRAESAKMIDGVMKYLAEKNGEETTPALSASADPDASASPSASADPDASPSASADPDASASPSASADPDASASPSASPSATPKK